MTTIDDSRLEPEDAEATRPPAYYEGCTGYDAGFLAVFVAPPTLTTAQRDAAARNRAAPPGADPNVLPYTHFSVVMHRARRLAWYTAVNVDGAHLVALPRGRDRWYLDSRLLESDQVGEQMYARNALDRGHLVRRLDPVWGPDAARAADDTFHFTNCSPQHEKFNQGAELWLGLEDYLLRNAGMRQRRMTVFTGPVLAATDPVYRGVRLPLAFWKIAVYVDPDGDLAAAAYMLEQAELVKDLPGIEAVFVAGTYRVSLSHLRERTGLDFSHLAAAELPLSVGGPELAGATAGHVPVQAGYVNLVL